jgi:hypothetical protein
VAPAESASAGGLKLQSAFAGSAPHAKLKGPEAPFSGVRTSVKLATAPALTVWEPEPESPTVKSKPMPCSGTEAALGRVEVLTVRLPVCAPAAVGAKAIAAAQAAPGARVVAQLLLTNWKPAGTVSERSFRVVSEPEFATEIATALLAWPTPVVGKLSVAGVTVIPAATVPGPLSCTTAEFAMDAELTVSAPVASPVETGAKRMPTVQFAPTARVPPQEFWARENAPLTASERLVAAPPLLLLTVTVCTELLAPAMVAGKLNCAGTALSPETACPAPLKDTTIGVTPNVEEETVNAAVLLPAAAGVKTTCTAQLAPAASDAGHEFAPTPKLVAAEPEI